jgi:hypothetical protein
MDKFMIRMRWISLPIISLLLAGCTQIFTFSPERAAVQALLSPHQRGQVLTDTIEVLQSKEQDGVVLVMLKYQMAHEGLVFDCDYVYETQKRSIGWVSLGGGGGCSSGPMDEQQVSLGWGGGSKNGDSTSRVHAIVYDQEINSMEVRWDDEMVQREEVINGSFMAIRKGKGELSQATGYDADDNVIYRWEAPETAPGKQIPSITG